MIRGDIGKRCQGKPSLFFVVVGVRGKVTSGTNGSS